MLVPGELTEEQACRELVGRAVAELGRIDILVNNAAYRMAQPGGIADITTEQFDRVMKTNLYAMFWLCKHALPHMRSGGSIINTSSVQAASPSPELLDYSSPPRTRRTSPARSSPSRAACRWRLSGGMTHRLLSAGLRDAGARRVRRVPPPVRSGG